MVQFLFVTALWFCLNAQAAINIHSHPTAGEYRAPAKALLDLGIATTKILSNGVWIYWNSQTEPDHLIASLKQKLPGGFALEHNDQGAFQVSPPSETGLPKVIIYPAPVQPANPSWLTPSKTLSLVNRENLHTVAQAIHHLTTGEAAPSAETDPASRERARHLATIVPYVQHLYSLSQTPAPTPLGWDDDNEAFLFRQNKPLPDSPSLAQSVINDVLEGSQSRLTVKPSPTKSAPDEIRFNQYSNQPKAASASSTQASPSPSASQAASAQSTPGPASPSGATSVGMEGTRSLQTMETEGFHSISEYEEEVVSVEKHVTLPEGKVVRDYSQHRHFHRYMKKMPFSEAETIKELVNKYPDHYPMPGMAVTAEQMIDEIARMKTRKNLRFGEVAPLQRLEQDVMQLKADAQYPYLRSLSLSYRFLHYKALLDYREQIETHAKGTAKRRQYEPARYSLMDAGIIRMSYYKNDCSLLQLEQVCWSNILKNDGSFKQALSEVYNCDGLHRSNNSGFLALVSGIPLIPSPAPMNLTSHFLTAPSDFRSG